MEPNPISTTIVMVAFRVEGKLQYHTIKGLGSSRRLHIASQRERERERERD